MFSSGSVLGTHRTMPLEPWNLEPWNIARIRSMRNAFIVSAVRLPTGKFLGTPQGLHRARAGRHGGSRSGDARGHRARHCRRVHHGQRRLGRRRPGAGAAGGAQGRPRRSRGRAHHQQSLRLGPQGGDARAPGHPDRRHRHRGGRRHGVDEQLPVHHSEGARRPAHGQRLGRRLDDSRRPVVPVRKLAHGERRRIAWPTVYKVTREQQDQYSVESHKKAAAAQSAGKFSAEILPVTIPQKKGDPLVFAQG